MAFFGRLRNLLRRHAANSQDLHGRRVRVDYATGVLPNGVYKRPLLPPAVDFISDEGKELYLEAIQNGTMEGFCKLVSNFQTQSEPTFCGLASLSMVLNTLAIDPGMIWKGHFSPIGGYHAGKDMALVLDVARYKYPPHWVPLTVLWEGMNCIDESTGKPRGFMLLSRPHENPGVQ